MCLAIPGEVVEFLDEENHLARVDVAGVHRTVNVGLLVSDASEGSEASEGADGSEGYDDEGIGPGDWVLIHVGFAISKVDEEEAARTFEFLETIGRDFEDELEELKGSDIA